MMATSGGARRRFIAHRGVHLASTIAGENSLEAVRLARRAGFACIETDTRLSADGELVVMHVAHDSHDRSPGSFIGADADPLAERVLPCEQRSCGGSGHEQHGQ